MSSYGNAWLAPKRGYRFYNLCRHRPRCTGNAACRERVEHDVTSRSARLLRRIKDESEEERRPAKSQLNPAWRKHRRGYQTNRAIQSAGYGLHQANGGAPVLSDYWRRRLGSSVFQEATPEQPAVSERARRVVTVRRGPANPLAMLRSDVIGAQIVRALTPQYVAPEMRDEAFEHECVWTMSRRTGRWGCCHGFNADADTQLTERGDEA